MFNFFCYSFFCCLVCFKDLIALLNPAVLSVITRDQSLAHNVELNPHFFALAQYFAVERVDSPRKSRILDELALTARSGLRNLPQHFLATIGGYDFIRQLPGGLA